MIRTYVPRAVFFACVLAAAIGYVGPPAALAIGLLFSLTLGNPFEKKSRAAAKHLLQASVVALGFGMNIGEVAHAGATGFIYTALGIGITTTFGILLGEMFRVDRGTAYLVTAGTAICGGSAIAALGPIIEASEEQMAISLGTVFILNAVGLFLFPPIGHALGLSQMQFGLWCALAIHDTSSVVGAAARYGSAALAIATTVKLARALWIIPVSISGLFVRKQGGGRIQFPWFIPLFCAAAIAKSLLPALSPVWSSLTHAGRLGLTVTLFLIGSGLSVKNLRVVGVRPLALGVLLWMVAGTGSLVAIYYGWVRV